MPKTSVSVEQFMALLEKHKEQFKWIRYRNGCIRAYNFRGAMVCPITAVLYAEKIKLVHHWSWLIAGRTLGMSHTSANMVVAAADKRTNDADFNKALRRQMIAILFGRDEHADV